MRKAGERQHRYQWIVALIWLGIWYVAAVWVDLPVLLPGPVATLRALFSLVKQGAFWQSMVMSLLRIAAGYTLAISLGCLLATLCAFFKPADMLLSPLKTLIRSTPVSSFIILVLLWLRIDRVPILISFLTVLPIIWQNVQEGIQQVDRNLLEMAKAYGFDRGKSLRYIYIPSVQPYLYTAAATSIGFAWKSGIAAEVIAKPIYSIGKHLQDSKVYLLTEELFAWTLTVILLSIALELLLKAALSRQAVKRRAQQ